MSDPVFWLTVIVLLCASIAFYCSNRARIEEAHTNLNALASRLEAVVSTLDSHAKREAAMSSRAKRKTASKRKAKTTS